MFCDCRKIKLLSLHLADIVWSSWTAGQRTLSVVVKINWPRITVRSETIARQQTKRRRGQPHYGEVSLGGLSECVTVVRGLNIRDSRRYRAFHRSTDGYTVGISSEREDYRASSGFFWSFLVSGSAVTGIRDTLLNPAFNLAF